MGCIDYIFHLAKLCENRIIWIPAFEIFSDDIIFPFVYVEGKGR